MNDQVEEVQRALDALETYSTVWITSLAAEGMSTKEIMFYKNADGTSIWFEMMKVRSELLLARAMATGPLAQEAEAQRFKKGGVALYYCEICKGLVEHKTKKHPWPSREEGDTDV